MVVVSVIVALAYGSVHAEPSIKIVNGKEAPAHEYPFVLSLQDAGYHMCGAGLISREAVMRGDEKTVGALIAAPVTGLRGSKVAESAFHAAVPCAGVTRGGATDSICAGHAAPAPRVWQLATRVTTVAQRPVRACTGRGRDG